MQYRGHVLIARNISVINYDHGYEATSEAWDVRAAFGRAVEGVRTGLPAQLRHCARHVGETPHGHPWGMPRKKGSRRYDRWRVNALRPDCETRWETIV